jgi:hypothetical protein
MPLLRERAMSARCSRSGSKRRRQLVQRMPGIFAALDGNTGAG